MKLDKFNGNTPSENWVNLGLHLICIKANGKAQVFSAVGKSFVKNAQGQPSPIDMEIPEAFEKAKKWSKYMWEHNDKEYLVNEYGLTKKFVREYFEYTRYGI